MTQAAEGLYAGRVIHHRLRPRAHRLSYRHFMLLVDIDRLDALAGRLKLFAHDRFGLFSLHDRDYGAGAGTALRDHVERQLAQAGLAADGGAIRLLTIPRLLGYAFNPLSVYFCHRRDGTLSALLYEVNNTFGQRHSYLIPVEAAADGIVRQSCDKAFYVSPFLDMDLHYEFRVHAPDETVRIEVGVGDGQGPLLRAVFAGERRALNDRELLRVFLGFPLQTLKVIAGIHVEALRIWLKGVALRPRPAPPAHPVSIRHVTPSQGISEA